MCLIIVCLNILYKNNGFYLVDSTSSIYVYNPDVAAQVSVGNNISIAAIKDYYILASEQNLANKFGYEGSNQLTDVVLLSNDKNKNEVDYSWTETKSIKSMLEQPVTGDFTTLVYKTTALVKEVPGNGFTNFYFFDLDENTGSYTYTQCNGNDFSYLDEFDGKVCTVYMTAHNAKSTKSD